MTEHTRIPAPGKGSSLFERAEGMFGDAGFAPAPIPRDLPHRRVAKMAPTARCEPEAGRPVVQDEFGQEALLDTTFEEHHAKPEGPPRGADLPPELLALPDLQYPVDRDLLHEYGMINPEGAVSALLEEFRIVKRQILKTARERGNDKARRILVTSPLPNEGKSFCAINLALALASERDCEVVLVDGDVAKPSILSMLGLPKGPGLMDALANPDVQIEDCVIATDVGGLFVLPAGNQTHADSEYLSSVYATETLDRLTAYAPNRLLIIDSPPVLAASPAADLARHVGQTLLVVKADRTGQSALEDALMLLSDCADLKLLLNDAHFSPSGRRFGSYYGQED